MEKTNPIKKSHIMQFLIIMYGMIFKCDISTIMLSTKPEHI